MLNNFIYAKQKSLFEEALNNGEVLDEAIVFIEDTKEIWNHGTYFDCSSVDLSGYHTKEEIAAELAKYAKISAIPTRVSQLENDVNYALKSDVEVEVEVEIPNGVYAVTVDGKLIDYNTADSSCLGVALVKGDRKFMIAKSDATNDGSIYKLYWLYSCTDLSLTNYSTIDATNSKGYLPKTDGTYQSTPHLSADFTTWIAGALSDFNGKANTEVIAAASSDARDMCTVLNTFNAADSFKDWYVPACGQLALMYLNMTEINAALAKIGGTTLAAEVYWSSSENSSNLAWFTNLYRGYSYISLKDSSVGRVRFVRDLTTTTLKKPLKERVSELESLPKISAIADNAVYVNNLELPVYTASSERCIKSCKGIEYDNDKVLIDAYGINFIPEDTDSPDSKTWNIHSRGDGTKFLSDDGTYKETVSKETFDNTIGDINTILESIIGNTLFPITLKQGETDTQLVIDLFNYVDKNQVDGTYTFKSGETVTFYFSTLNKNYSITYLQKVGSGDSYINREYKSEGIHLGITKLGGIIIDYNEL